MITKLIVVPSYIMKAKLKIPSFLKVKGTSIFTFPVWDVELSTFVNVLLEQL